MRHALLAFSLLVVACSSSSGSNGPSSSNGDSVNGAVGGTSFDAKDAIFTTSGANGFDFDARSTVVLMTTTPNACNRESSGTGVTGTLDLAFALAVTDASTHSSAITAPGTFTVVDDVSQITKSGSFAEVFFEPYCAGASTPASDQASSGTVTVKSVDAGTITATFDLTFPTGHVSGSFSAASCAALDPNRSIGCK